MARLRRTRTIAPVATLVASLALLSACSTRPGVVVVPFVLDRSIGYGRQDLVPGTALVVAPTAGAQPAAVTRVGTGAGSVSIRFESLLPQDRALMATVHQVAAIKITLYGPPGFDPVTFDPIENVVATVTIDRAALDAGTRQHTFTGLAPTEYFFEVSALDAAGSQLGTFGTTVDVVDATPIEIDARIRLVPTLHMPSPQPSGSSGGSSGGGPTPTPTPAGQIGARITLEDGLDVDVLPKVGGFDVAAPRMIVAAPGGRLAVTSANAVNLYEPDGTLVWSVPLGATIVTRPIFDATGRAWISTAAGVVRVEANGAQTASIISFAAVPHSSPNPAHATELALDGTGQLWAVLSDWKLVRVATDGTVVLVSDATGLKAIAAAPDGTMWTGVGGNLERLDAAGQVVESRTTQAGWLATEYFRQLVPLPAFDRLLTILSAGLSPGHQFAWILPNVGIIVDDPQLNVQTDGKHIVLAPDGRAWLRERPNVAMADGRAHVYARRNEYGQVLDYFLPEDIEAAHAFCFTGDGVLWLADYHNNRIGRYLVP